MQEENTPPKIRAVPVKKWGGGRRRLIKSRRSQGGSQKIESDPGESKNYKSLKFMFKKLIKSKGAPPPGKKPLTAPFLTGTALSYN